ncbi:MAG: dTDP-4-dehydrorhamnose reductase [Barnesiella sp.]|nr:dTDP-4-dehydrorhamnose reductase [Barnesiella sp.]
MKILLTGANGQLGRELQHTLESNLPGITTYTDVDSLDITDAKAVSDFVSANEFTHIINCAAYTAVDKAETDQMQCYKINADAVRNIAMAASENGIKVVHISTDYVFDGKSFRPYNEADKVNPVSAYGTSKRKGEMALLSFCPDAIIIRTAWLYSPHGHNFVKTMLKNGASNKELRVVFDQIGSPTSATDLAEAILTVISSRQWISGIYHFTNEGVASWYDFATKIHKLAGITSCRLTPITTDLYPTPATRPFYSVLDKSKIKKTFGIRIPHWEESLEKCLKRITL